MPVVKSALDSAILRANAGLWRMHGGGLRPVLKSFGYGWGTQKLVSLLEDEADGFCVLDSDECSLVRAGTAKPIILLGFGKPEEIAGLLDMHALPNIADLAQLDAAIAYANERRRRVTLRCGIAPSLGWKGVAAHDLDAFLAAACACPYLEFELWTHFTHARAYAAELRDFERFIARFTEAGLHVVGLDAASTASLSSVDTERFRPARIGIGLFGAGKATIPQLQCALQLDVEVLERRTNAPGLVAGYARRELGSGRFVETWRIGYGDGFPRGLIDATLQLPNGPARIVNIGMQHTVVVHELPAAPSRRVFFPDTDLDRLCANGGTSVHELVVGLGLSAARRATEAKIR